MPAVKGQRAVPFLFAEGGWEQQTMERMLSDGVDTFVEIGPGRTLTGFLRKMTKEARLINVETLEQLEGLSL